MNSGALTRVTLILGKSLNDSEAASILENESRFLVTTMRVEDVARSMDVPMTDVVIAEIEDMTEEELQIFSEVRAIAPDIPLILLSNALDHDAMQKLLRYHVQDWLLKPVDKPKLLTSLRSSVRTNRNSHNTVNAIISCVGGAGATTVAINMADIASRKLAKKDPNIALVDLDFSTGNCGYVLNMVSSLNLGSVKNAHRRIDSEFISVIQQKHDAGFYLYSFKRPDVNTEMNGQELILRLLDAISLEHSLLFLDIPYYATEWRDDVLAGVNSCTLVSEVNLPAIKHTLDLLEHIRSIRGDDFPVHVLFNKHANQLFGQRISKSKIEELLGDTPFTFLPVDSSTIGEAMDRGVLASEISTRSAFLKKLTAYMESMNLLGTKKK